MKSTDVVIMAREHLYGVPGLCVDLGFKVVDKHQYDVNEWRMECVVFDMLTSRMVPYKIVISGDAVKSIRRI